MAEERNYSELLSLISSVNHLVGWEPFKEYANELPQLAKEMEKHDSYFCFRNQAYLFSVNDGCGMTRVINLLTLIGKEIGAFDRDSYYEYILSGETKGKRKTIADILEIVLNKENYGQMLCLDISEFLDKGKHEQFKSFLKELSHVSKDYNIVFRVPYIEQQSLQIMKDLISDIFLLRTFQIPPFSDEQLQEYVEDDLNDYDFKMDPASWELFHARIREEKSDGKFYGLRTAQKVANEIVLRKHKYDSSLPKGSAKGNIIYPEELDGLAENKPNKKSGFEELEELVGMESVIARVKEIVSQLKLAVNNDKIERPSMHMRFLGAPGTGKTTVARIIGKIFAENGLLSNGYFFEYEARDLCGEYIGQTAPRTASICRDAYGSVLFIDEAYGLYGGERSSEDYGIEAITTLIAEMENHRNDMVVIMAGYKEPMERLMGANVGLRSRMPFVIEFPSYSKEVLTTIFMTMVKKHFECSDDLEEAVKNYFDELPQSYIDSEEFSNARFVRNLYERTWSKMAMRTQLNGIKEMVLMAEDFRSASCEREFSEKLSSSSRRKVGY